MTVQDAAAELEAGAVSAVIPYVVAGESAVFYPGQRELSYWPVEDHVVTIHDARAIAHTLSLERNGFVLLNQPTRASDLFDPDQRKAVYYPEVEALVKALTGARRVLIFGDIARTDAAGTPDGLLPARGAHVDYNEATVRWWTQSIAGPDEAAELLQRRFMLMNLWRPITTVQKTPLALCDASTVREEDLNPSEIRGGLYDPDRQPMHGFNLAFSPRHRWYYVPRMRPDEVLAFKLFDSDRGRLQWTGHTAFDDPTSAPDARPRQSLEIRTISFF
jgi:hypothetical protein